METRDREPGKNVWLDDDMPRWLDNAYLILGFLGVLVFFFGIIIGIVKCSTSDDESGSSSDSIKIEDVRR
jgi:hypothetical protein